ncbi:hypothetical protein O2N63_10490 [Aliiroseovarius sp. KMU-50]|uniref:Uncharacterized protein n=1 Tax=Aliiroseovarius salicola TaxID=3009082 RepID=A0ABT4W1X3_9RHOB|nr:hypothetical protein [Aliiroseovarius sp. KMU-50]MDA5094511.1 hypothetical protein [Aliiroseovarius sp. KMU-50]
MFTFYQPISATFGPAVQAGMPMAVTEDGTLPLRTGAECDPGDFSHV